MYEDKEFEKLASAIVVLESITPDNFEFIVENLPRKKCIALVREYQQEVKEVSDELYEDATQALEYLMELNDVTYAEFLKDLNYSIEHRDDYIS